MVIWTYCDNGAFGHIICLFVEKYLSPILIRQISMRAVGAGVS